MNLTEIVQRQAAIRDELARIQNNPATVEETDGDMVDTLISEFDSLETRRQPLAERASKLNLIAAAGQNPENVDDGADDDRPAAVRNGPPDMVQRRAVLDPFSDMDRIKSGLVGRNELVSRAYTAIERAAKSERLDDNWAENATQSVRRSETPAGVAKHILETGTEEYEEHFKEYLRNPEGYAARAALSLTNANGGYLLPYVLDPTIVLTNSGSANPYRRVANIKQTTSSAWQGVSSAGVNAQWLAEAVMASDATPAVGQIQITPEKAAAWVYGSFEILQDTDFGAQLPGLLADAKDRLEEAAFTTGAGHGSQVPLGVISALGTGQRIAAAGGTGGAFAGTGGAADVYALMGGVPARFRNSAATAWIANLYYINKIRGLDQYGGSSFWANFGANQPEQLLGKGIYESTTMSSATATGTGTGNAVAVFGDFNQFYIVDRVGVSMIYEPLVKGSSATGSGSPGFPTGQSGWFMFWRTSSGVSTANAFRYLTNG